MKKLKFFKGANGLWIDGDNTFGNVAQILPDKTFKCRFIRESIQPYSLVYYYPESVRQLEKGMSEEMFFITVLPFGKGGNQPQAIPLYLLDLAATQVDELKRSKRLPQRAFKKPQIARTSEELTIDFPPEEEEE